MAFAAYDWALYIDSDVWMAVAYSGFMINLFNLIPVSPLDGGRITQVLSPRIWLLGAPLLVVLFFYIPSPMLILVFILAIPNLIASWRYDPNAPEARAYRSIPTATRVEYATMYLGLAALLALMVHNVHENLLHGQKIYSAASM